MDLSFFKTIQTSGQATPQSQGLLKDGNLAVPEGFELFFKSFLQSDFRTKEASTVPDTQSHEQNLNLQLEQSISSLELLFSKDLNTSEVYNLEDFLESSSTQLVISAEDQKIILPDETKLALLDRLLGTPFNLKGPSEAGTGNADTPFANTEATLNGDELFDRILQNITNGDAVNLPLEAVIAAGLTPNELASLKQNNITLEQYNVTLDIPVSQNDLDHDLISLLGLASNAPINSTMQQQGKTNFQHKTAWFEGEKVESNFKSELKNMNAPHTVGGQTTSTPAATNSQAAEVINNTANQNAVQNTSIPFIDIPASEGTLEWFDPVTQQWTQGPSLPSALNGSNITSTITQAPHAHSAHPATNMLAVSIQKQVNGQDSRNWTLQLDPPDLGKVEVELHFNKDKLVKTQMVIEKPETWMMLQRDAQILERALQEAGLDIDSGSLEFSLADSDHDFSQNGGHDGQDQQGGNAKGGEETEIIETTMTWFVDPESGLQRYDLMV